MMDTVGNKVARKEIAMIKVVAPNAACKVIDWAIQAYGGAGVDDDFLAGAYRSARSLRLAGLVQRDMRHLVDARAGSLGLAMAHEDETLAFRREGVDGGQRYDAIVTDGIDDLGHGIQKSRVG
jgi:hypothetical protein